MPKESVIQDAVLKYLNGIKGCVAENVHGNVYTSGRPDINACYKGKTVRIELKSPDHGFKPSTKQIINLRRWGKVGAIAIVAYSLDDVKYVIRKKGIKCLNEGSCAACPIKKEYCFCKFKEE